MIKAIMELFKDDTIYILSACPTEHGIQEKHEWLDEHFYVKEKNRYFVDYPKDSKLTKLDIIGKCRGIELKNMVLIDDNHNILRECEDGGVTVYHTSHVLSMYEELEDSNVQR